jgi:hypothetical protein
VQTTKQGREFDGYLLPIFSAGDSWTFNDRLSFVGWLTTLVSNNAKSFVGCLITYCLFKNARLQLHFTANSGHLRTLLNGRNATIFMGYCRSIFMNPATPVVGAAICKMCEHLLWSIVAKRV